MSHACSVGDKSGKVAKEQNVNEVILVESSRHNCGMWARVILLKSCGMG
jgi:hypothetical protein